MNNIYNLSNNSVVKVAAYKPYQWGDTYYIGSTPIGVVIGSNKDTTTNGFVGYVTISLNASSLDYFNDYCAYELEPKKKKIVKTIGQNINMSDNFKIVVPWHNEEQLNKWLSSWGLRNAGILPDYLILQQDKNKEGCAITKK